MDAFFAKLKVVFSDAGLRNRILFTLGALLIFRLLSVIPISLIDPGKLRAFFASNQVFGLINIFSGGSLGNLSIVMLGVGPYITGSIIMQLGTLMFPSLKRMYQEEGETGRKKFAMYSRIATLPLALLQSYGFIILLKNQGVITGTIGWFALLSTIIIISAGSMLLTWIGELISEFGMGNGVSLIIFAGIVSRIPTAISQLSLSYDRSQLPMYIVVAAAMIVVIYAVTVITEAERPIPVTYAKRVRGMKVYGGVSTYLPLRLNQSGVMPIIFALSLLLFPQMIFKFMAASANISLSAAGNFLTDLFNNQLFYGVAYFVLVFLFTYFYTAVTFDPEQIATNLQKNGAFIPGVRPGPSTSEHLSKTLSRLTFFGALFLGIIAILPLIVRYFTGLSEVAVGGTALLIVVSVIVDMLKKIDAQVSMREY